MADFPRRFELRHDAPCDIPEPEAIWPDASGQPGEGELVTERGEESYNRFVANIKVPVLRAFLPARSCGIGVVICPGGAYRGVAFDKEGCEVARFLNSIGAAAFVLNYRVPAPDGRPGMLPEAPLEDAIRTIRIVRARAGELGIEKDRIGIMGFSAGGHVAACASTLYGTVHDPDPAMDAVSPRPDFTALLYSVISVSAPYSHGDSARALLGESPSEQEALRFSPERQVDSGTPPAFLAMTEDDPVNPLNSIEYYKACLASGVKAELHAFPEGGHGYGMALRGLGVDSWPDRLAEWLRRLFNVQDIPKA